MFARDDRLGENRADAEQFCGKDVGEELIADDDGLTAADA
jgi:hypothetical protein